MKTKLYFLSFFVASIFLTSCAKYEKMFDMDWDDMNLDGTMNWGVPLIDADYTVEKLLTYFGNDNNITYDLNGNYKLEYITPQKEYLNVEKYTKLSDVVLESYLDLSQQDTLHLFLETFTEDVELRKATFKNGYIRFDFSKVTGNPSDDYDILITSTTFFNPDNTPFSLKLSKNHAVENVQCANYKAVTPNNRIDFFVKIIPIIGNSTCFFPRIESHDIFVKNADITVIQEQTKTISSATEFYIFPNNKTLEATIYYPKLYLDVNNTFGVSTKIMFTKINLKGPSVMESIMNPNRPPIFIPKNFTGQIEITDQILPELPVNLKYDSLLFECVSVVSLGNYSVLDNAVVDLGMTAIIPFDMQIDGSLYHDTLGFSIPNLSNLTFFDTVTLRTAFINSLPLGVDAQIWFYNSGTQKVVDSLFVKPISIKGSYNNIPMPSEVQYITVTNEKLKTLQQIDKIILNVNVGTDGRHAPFKREHNLHVKLGARIKSIITH